MACWSSCVGSRERLGPAASYPPLLPVVPRGKPHVAETLSSGVWSVLYSPVGTANHLSILASSGWILWEGEKPAAASSVWSQGLAAAGCSVHIWVDVYCLSRSLAIQARGAHIANGMSGWMVRVLPRTQACLSAHPKTFSSHILLCLISGVCGSRHSVSLLVFTP